MRHTCARRCAVHPRASDRSGGVHRHTTTPRQRGGRHATGPVSAHRRDGMFRAPIYERDWRPSCIVCRSSSSSVVRLVSSDARTSMHVTTAVSSLLKLRLLVGEILANSEDYYSTPAKSLNCTVFSNVGWRSGLLRTWLSTPLQYQPGQLSGQIAEKANAGATHLLVGRHGSTGGVAARAPRDGRELGGRMDA